LEHLNWRTGFLGLLLISSFIIVSLSGGKNVDIPFLEWSGHRERGLSGGGGNPFFSGDLLFTSGRGSPNGHAAGVQIWKPATGELQYLVPTGTFTQKGLSPNARYFFSGGDGSPFSKFNLWDLETREHILELPYPRYWSILGFTKDSEHLLRVIQGKLELWHFPSNRIIYSIELPSIRLGSDVTWSPDRRHLIFGLFESREYRLLEVDTGAMQTIPIPLPPGRLKLFSDDGTMLAVATEEAVKVYDVQTWSHQFNCAFLRGEGGRGEQEPIYLSPNRNLLVMTSGGKHSYDFNVCDTSGNRLSRIIAQNYGWGISPDGEVLAIYPGNDTRHSIYTVELWSTRTGEVIRTLCSRMCYGGSPQLDSLTFSPDGHWLVVTSNGNIDLWGLKASSRSPRTLLHPCNEPASPGCLNLIETARTSKDLAVARPAYSQGCATDPLFCLLRGAQDVTVPGVAQEIPASYKQCALGHPEGCYTIASDLSLRAKAETAPLTKSFPGLCDGKTRGELFKLMEMNYWDADARGGAIPIFALPPTHPWRQFEIHPGDVIALVNGNIPWRFNPQTQMEQACKTPSGLALTIYRFQDGTTITLADTVGRGGSEMSSK